MVRRVFFSFDYDRDVWKAEQIRNSWVTQGRGAAGFFDAAEREEVKRGGDKAIYRWIDRQLQGTSVTLVLVGAETYKSKFVKYEIKRSLEKEKPNGIILIHINNLKNQNGQTDQKGDIDFGEIDGIHDISDICQIYDWVNDKGYDNIGDWIEISAQMAGRQTLEPPPVRSVSASSRPGSCWRK